MLSLAPFDNSVKISDFYIQSGSIFSPHVPDKIQFNEQTGPLLVCYVGYFYFDFFHVYFLNAILHSHDLVMETPVKIKAIPILSKTLG